MDSHVQTGPFSTEDTSQAWLTPEPIVVAKKEGTEVVAVEKASWAGGGPGQPKAATNGQACSSLRSGWLGLEEAAGPGRMARV